MEIVAGDIGGTNARFAIATKEDDGRILLSHVEKLPVSSHATFESAWGAYEERVGRPLPRTVSIAIAGPVDGKRISLTNNAWSLLPEDTRVRLGLEQLRFVNDFAAVAHSVSALPADGFTHIAGPAEPPASQPVITLMGPGTGLGVAILDRSSGYDHVLATEGGHMDFAPLDEVEDRMLAVLRQRFRRVSVERIVSGPGLANIYEALARIEGRPFRPLVDAELWTEAREGKDRLMAAALDRWFMSLGAAAGDFALAHGSLAVVLGGGVLPRLVDRLPGSGFAARFTAKGRFEKRMASIPVHLITYPEPGLLGAAAAAFA